MAYDATKCLTHDQVITYVAGYMSELDQASVMVHSNQCHVCRREIAEEQAFNQRMQNSAVSTQDIEDMLDEKYPGWRS